MYVCFLFFRKTNVVREVLPLSSNAAVLPSSSFPFRLPYNNIVPLDVQRYLLVGTGHGDFFLPMKDLAICKRVNKFWKDVLTNPKIISSSYTKWFGCRLESGWPFILSENEFVVCMSPKYVVTYKDSLVFYENFYLIGTILDSSIFITHSTIVKDKFFWMDKYYMLGCYNLKDKKIEWKFKGGNIAYLPLSFKVDEKLKNSTSNSNESSIYYQINIVTTAATKEENKNLCPITFQFRTYRVEKKQSKEAQKNGKEVKWKLLLWRRRFLVRENCIPCNSSPYFGCIWNMKKSEIYVSPCPKHREERQKSATSDNVQGKDTSSSFLPIKTLCLHSNDNRNLPSNWLNFYYDENKSILYEWGDKKQPRRIHAYKLSPQSSLEYGEYMDCRLLFTIQMDEDILTSKEISGISWYEDRVFVRVHNDKIWQFTLNHL